MSTAPPNWYPDPDNDGIVRYWDGTAWTEQRRPVGPAAQTGPDTAPGAKVPLFGARGFAKRQSQELADALAENQRLRGRLAQTGGLEVADLERLRDELATQVTDQQTLLDTVLAQLAAAEAEVIRTREESVLQEIGIYDYRHPLTDSVAYRDALARLQDEVKGMARRDGGAIEAQKAWVVEGSAAQGRKMIREYSKLMLRAYNAEADNLVRALKPYKLRSALERLDKIALTLERFGATMSLRVAPAYHHLRRYELELTADHLELLARRKEYEREERDRLREERRAHEELTREQTRLEQQHRRHRDALVALEAGGTAETDAIGALRAKLAELELQISSVKNRAGNLRAGHIYVISNIGAFGAGVVQIGLTRRFDPWERIRDLSNASVPFGYDVHTLFFDNDAAGIEDELHRRLERQRVNKVNRRREFFYATPAEVRSHLGELTTGVLEFTELPEAVQYRQSHPTPGDGAPR
ncbi:DUF4041 domain-containing protein [Nocardia sp. NPDC059177]|uniref:DUF4041 domain-containing protein n=1 Tax=Nocardia sp. NPDC059177 TaxID=3346759 RepID=UPI0036754040